MKGSTLLMFLYGIGIIIAVGFWGAMIYITAHFAIKYW